MHNSITEEARKIISEIPARIKTAAAVKTRTPEEVQSAVDGGISIIAHNYVQEAEKMLPRIGESVKWHLIGNLQKNKVKRAVRVFDMIETIDSLKLCESVDKHCKNEGIIMPILIQINIAGEKTKAGIEPGSAEKLLSETKSFKHISIEGLMTIEPSAESPEECRIYFKRMKKLFDKLKRSPYAGPNFRYLSMGMSRTYKTAIEEGANIIRVGSRIFGERRKINAG